MKRQITNSMLALALFASWGLAHATQSAVHNDLDGDGRSDLIWRNADDGSIAFWSGANSAKYTTVRVAGLAYNVPGDFDLRRMTIVLTYSDAFTDPSRSVLLAQDPLSGDFGLFPDANGAGYHAYALVGSSDWKVAGAGDFDGNGTADLLYRNKRDGRNLLLSDAAWGDWAGIYPVASVTDLAWEVAGVGDFDGDGVSDILWHNTVTGANTIWLSANPQTRQDVTRVTNLAWRIVAVGDFNGNGKSDIFWRNINTGANAIWESGNYYTRLVVASVTNLSWQVTATGDFHGDGKWDLFWRNTSTGANVIWKSANAATPQAVTGVRNQAWSTVK